MYIVGSVENVIAGKRPEENWISANEFAYAFELGSPLGIETMGEMVAMNGWVFVHEPESGTLLTGNRFVTSGAFIIPHGLEPEEVVWKGDPITCETLYTQIGPGPIAFAGVIHCKELYGTAISKAPIHGENIFENKKTYYSRDPLHLKDVYIAIVGVVGKGMKEVLYDTSHTHCLVLNREVERIEDVTVNDAKTVLHLFSESTIDRVSLNVYPITTDLIHWNSGPT